MVIICWLVNQIAGIGILAIKRCHLASVSPLEACWDDPGHVGADAEDRGARLCSFRALAGDFGHHADGDMFVHPFLYTFNYTYIYIHIYTYIDIYIYIYIAIHIMYIMYVCIYSIYIDMLHLCSIYR